MTRYDDLTRLRHMRDHAREAIEISRGKSVDELANNRLLELSLARLIEIIGEAASRVGPEQKAGIPGIEWPKVIGMRHHIVHGYDRVDRRILWDTVLVNLPPLVEQLEQAIRKIEQLRET